MKFRNIISYCILFISFVGYAFAQQTNQFKRADQVQLNTITTAVPFLQITPDSRSGALGDAGVALSPDANSTHSNPSKLAFIEEDMGVSLSYSPWLRNLVPDINLSYVSFFKRIDKRSAIGASLRYFSLGKITFTNNQAQAIGDFNPNEFGIDFTYASKLSDYFSIGVTGRFINSNLTQGQAESNPGRAVAADVSAFYESDRFRLGDYNAVARAGANISNIGSKISYTETSDADFIPINMRLGAGLTLDLDDYNQLTFLFDVNKLLVPTPPIYQLNEDGGLVIDSEGNPVIEEGEDPNRGIASGMFGSFNDAPGGSAEEFRELNYSVGLEYWYDQQFAVRLGYFYEHPTKGARQFFTAGLGLRLNVIGIDLAYLVGNAQRNPLANTVRLSLLINFDDLTKPNTNN
jgi:hypothetical protein